MHIYMCVYIYIFVLPLYRESTHTSKQGFKWEIMGESSVPKMGLIYSAFIASVNRNRCTWRYNVFCK